MIPSVTTTTPPVVQASPVVTNPQQQAPLQPQQAPSPAMHPPPYRPIHPPRNTMAATNGPPPPPPIDASHNVWALPPGWRVARRESDGRMYYWEVETGRTSWSHPLASKQPPIVLGGNIMNRGIHGPMSEWEQMERRKDLLDTPMNARSRPDSHQCCAIASIIMCAPLGLLALYHSFNVDKHWNHGRYGDAMNSSKQAYNFAWFGCVLGGIIFIIYWMRVTDFEFPKFDFNFGD